MSSELGSSGMSLTKRDSLTNSYGFLALPIVQFSAVFGWIVAQKHHRRDDEQVRGKKSDSVGWEGAFDVVRLPWWGRDAENEPECSGSGDVGRVEDLMED